MPLALKEAVIRLSLKLKKREILEHMDNFWSLSNLSFVSKISRKVVTTQLFLGTSGYLDSLKHSFCSGNTTETPVVSLTDIPDWSPGASVFLFVLLDLLVVLTISTKPWYASGLFDVDGPW